MPSSRRALIVAAACVAAMTGVSAAPSSAEDNTNPGPVTEHGPKITITLTSTTSTEYKDGGRGNTGGSYTLPPCWYESVGDTNAFQDLLDRYKLSAHGSSDPQTNDWQAFLTWLDPWEKALGPHKGENPPGTWYQAGCADWSSTEAQTWTQSNPDFIYVGPNKPTPPGDTIVTPLMLAQYAVKSAVLPPPAPIFSPVATSPSYVNLTTWAWQQLDKTRLDLSASLNTQSATVYMTPTAMTLTTDGRTASGIPTVCTEANSYIGVPYAQGDTDPAAPGCGLKFTARGNYVIHARGTWKITWTSPQVQGVQTLPDVQLNTDTPVTVKEIQSIN